MNKQHHTRLIKHLKWLDKFVYETISDPKIQINILKVDQPLLCTQIAKMHTTYGSIIVLIQKGLGQDAMILMRSLFNNLINIKWIAADDQTERANLFIDYNKILRKRMLDIAKKHPERIEVYIKFTKQEPTITKNYESVKHKYPNPHEWSGKALRKRADEVGHAWDYDFVYTLSSSFEHSDVHSVGDFLFNIDRANKILSFRAGPSTKLIPEAAIASAQYMGLAIELFINKFTLDKYKLRKLLQYSRRLGNFFTTLRASGSRV